MDLEAGPLNGHRLRKSIGGRRLCTLAGRRLCTMTVGRRLCTLTGGRRRRRSAADGARRAVGLGHRDSTSRAS
jgi:hypothetical protein